MGEEDVAVDLSSIPYRVDGLIIPAQFSPMVDKARTELDRLSKTVEARTDVTIFIDPIDGTREFASGLGEQCSICIGFANASGEAVAGLVYRPIPSPTQWAGGAGLYEEADNFRCCSPNFDSRRVPADNVLMTTNGSISPFTDALIDLGSLTRRKSGGAGNKCLMLLEGHGSAYIQDRGVSRWDTLAAEAVLRAWGGELMKLTTITDNPQSVITSNGKIAKPRRYTYLKSSKNLDFVPNQAHLIKNNMTQVGIPREGTLANDVSQVKPYSNLAGLFAISPSCARSLPKFALWTAKAAIKRAPTFS